MKKLIVIAVLITATLNGYSQISFGIKGGLSSADVSAQAIELFNDVDEGINLAVKDYKYGYHFGGFINARLGKLYLQPELVFNSNSVDYTLQKINLGGVTTSVKNENFQYLDIPVLLGLKLGAFRINAGPVGHVFLNNTSDLFEIDSYSQNFDPVTWGWQGGIGLDLWKFNIDLRYEGNFNKYGNHIEIAGQSFNFSDDDNRVLLSLGFTF